MEAPDFRIPLRELPPIIGGKTRWFVALTLGPLFSFIAFALLTDRTATTLSLLEARFAGEGC